MLLETPNGVDLIQIVYFWFCNAWYDVCGRFAFLITFCCIIKSAYQSLIYTCYIEKVVSQKPAG